MILHHWLHQIIIQLTCGYDNQLFWRMLDSRLTANGSIFQLALSMDTDLSGTIDLPEFLQSMAKSKADEDAEDDIREAFMVSLFTIETLSNCVV